MKRTASLIVVAAAGAALSVFGHAPATAGTPAHGQPAPAAGPQREGAEFRLREPLAAGRTLEIRGVNGNVTAEPAPGGEFEVVAVRRARRSDPDEVKVEVVRHAGGVLICAVYPSTSGGQNTCEPGPGHRSNVNNNDTSVDFSVRVPAGVRFEGRTVNGNVDARDLGSDVVAHTVNGNIRLSTTGLAQAQTVNGSITAVMGRADWDNGLDFKTVNGGIDLSFPATLSANVDARTLNGSITSDFPLTVTGTYSRRRLTGTVGGGSGGSGRELRLETVNGSVHLRRAS